MKLFKNLGNNVFELFSIIDESDDAGVVNGEKFSNILNSAIVSVLDIDRRDVIVHDFYDIADTNMTGTFCSCDMSFVYTNKNKVKFVLFGLFSLKSADAVLNVMNLRDANVNISYAAKLYIQFVARDDYRINKHSEMMIQNLMDKLRTNDYEIDDDSEIFSRHNEHNLLKLLTDIRDVLDRWGNEDGGDDLYDDEPVNPVSGDKVKLPLTV